MMIGNIKLIMKDIDSKNKRNISYGLKKACKTFIAGIKQEMRSPKSGTPKRRINRWSTANRSMAISEALERDTGNAERKLASEVNGSTAIVGFKVGDNNYVRYWELDAPKQQRRYTMKISFQKNKGKITSDFKSSFK